MRQCCCTRSLGLWPLVELFIRYSADIFTIGVTLAAPVAIARGDFAFDADARGVSRLRHRDDPFGATLTTPAATGRGGAVTPAAALGVTVTYRRDARAPWVDAPRGEMTAEPDGVTYRRAPSAAAPLGVVERYRTDGRALDWTIELSAASALHVGDLGISLPVQGPTGENPAQIFERGFLKHQFISGAGSFFFYVRASGAPPFSKLPPVKFWPSRYVTRGPSAYIVE